MKIQVLGSGCKKCKELYDRVQQVVNNIDKNISVEYITDVQKIIDIGLVSSPVLLIDEKPVLVGELPNIEKIEKIISENISKNCADDNDRHCPYCCDY